MKKKIYRAVDLFAGIGGIRLGFQQSFQDTIKFVFSNEIDDNACKTYQRNFGINPKGDIRNINIKSIPDFDILLAGFPCQSFSLAGKKNGFNDIRGSLFFYIAEILRIKKPEAFLLENVKNLLNHDKGRTLKIILDILQNELNYHVFYQVLNAKDFGVPQNRERIYIVGFKNIPNFDFPEHTTEKCTIRDILESNVDDSYYLSQMYLNGLKCHKERNKKKGNGYGFEIRSYDETANALVCGGMGLERNMIKDTLLTNCWDIGNPNLKLKNNEGIRKLTYRECARLQGFPDCYNFPVPKTRTYKLIANSVAVPVIKKIAENMKESLKDSPKTKESIEYECASIINKYIGLGIMKI